MSAGSPCLQVRWQAWSLASSLGTRGRRKWFSSAVTLLPLKFHCQVTKRRNFWSSSWTWITFISVISSMDFRSSMSIGTGYSHTQCLFMAWLSFHYGQMYFDVPSDSREPLRSSMTSQTRFAIVDMSSVGIRIPVVVTCFQIPLYSLRPMQEESREFPLLNHPLHYLLRVKSGARRRCELWVFRRRTVWSRCSKCQIRFLLAHRTYPLSAIESYRKRW